MSSMNTAFGAETFAVDTHIFRVGNRTGLAPGKTPLAVEQKLDKATPAPFRRDAHHWLILHGRYICKARKAGVLALPGGGPVPL
jgi:endonuclease-3